MIQEQNARNIVRFGYPTMSFCFNPQSTAEVSCDCWDELIRHCPTSFRVTTTYWIDIFSLPPMRVGTILVREARFWTQALGINGRIALNRELP